MVEDLDFSLPQPKQRKSSMGVITVVLLLAVLTLMAANLWLTGSKPDGCTQSDSVLSAEQWKELAGKLASRNFPEASVDAWRQYVQTAGLSAEEKARVFYKMGELLLKAEQPKTAIAYFYRSEMVGRPPDLEGRINAKIKECFEKAGEFAALRYEIMDRTSYKSAEDTSGEIVAQIGPEKITAVELDTMLEEHVEAQLSQYAAMLPPEQLQAQKETMLKQMNNPQSRQQFIQTMMAQEALYREALAQKLDENTKDRRQMRNLRRQFWAQRLLEREMADKVHIGKSDMDTYYQANKDKFVMPAEAEISQILLDTQEKALAAIERLNKGEDFSMLAKELSLDEATKSAGGKIAGKIKKDGYITGIGSAAELTKKIFAAGPDTLLDEPFKDEKGWHIIKVRSITPQKQQTFEEVMQDIYQTLTQQKRRELQQELIKRLMDKYNIVVHQSTALRKGDDSK